MPYGKLVNGVDVCKFGKQWVVSAAAMKRAYGEAKGSAVSRTHWPFFDHQLTTDSDFYCRWSVFIVGTLFYIACDRCAVAVQNQQKITVYHRIVLRVVVLRLLRQGIFYCCFCAMYRCLRSQNRGGHRWSDHELPLLEIDRFFPIIAYVENRWKAIFHTSASVAQLDRALASDARCRGFESLRAHLKTSLQCTFAMRFLLLVWILFLE